MLLTSILALSVTAMVFLTLVWMNADILKPVPLKIKATPPVKRPGNGHEAS